jgi:hypothetical protein
LGGGREGSLPVNLIGQCGQFERKKKPQAKRGLRLLKVFVGGSDLENIDQFLHGGCTLMQCGTFVVGKADLDDLLDAVLA